MPRLDNKQRKKMKREEKKQRMHKAQMHQKDASVEAQKQHSGKVMGAILIIMAVFGAAAIIYAYS